MRQARENRHLTFLIVPDGVGRSYALRVPTWLLKTCLVGLAAAAFVVAGFSQGYIQMAANMATLHRLQAVNRTQAQDIATARDNIAKLQSQLAQLLELDRTLRSEVDLPEPPGAQTDSGRQDAGDAGALALANAGLPLGAAGASMASSSRPDLLPQVSLAAVLPGVLTQLAGASGEPPAAAAGSYGSGDIVAASTALLAEASRRLASLSAVQSVVADRIREADHYPDLWPVTGHITSRFGNRRSPFGWGREFHEGIDIAAPYGTPVRAAASGVVIEAGYVAGFGRAVKIDHGNGFVTLYGHQSRIKARTGETVKKGQIIGYVGNSGLSTGPHLHFGIYRYGTLVDPYPILTSDRYAYLKGD